ncbi:unnamed protein product [Acanthoscelides obtectus]|uniref:CCHC-type domain-containing protein n=1 Tax=Acanthoscelides obtectus TaxID=200917 RepID=A0A9P0JGT4_ACAOB|nr:unnamed protein product [Acanthoscelides obtectus]CAK1624960.1 hypothetical protein AOBTE_LOCUS2873 [Acanthoscelides obtectus]
MSGLPAIETFDCEGEPSSVGLRWDKWRRAFAIFLEASSVVDPKKKRAMLLHSSGLPLQEIYYSIPGAHVDEPQGDNDVFAVAVQKLDEYFKPKQSKLYERYIFRKIKQESEETFDEFLVRLRVQGAKCKFSNVEEHLIDQIVEKCYSQELRKNILALGDTVNLDTIVAAANSLESINRELKGFSTTSFQEINKIQSWPTTSKQARNHFNVCSRCGGFNHRGTDKCPAMDKKCLKCGKLGHYKKQCRTLLNTGLRRGYKRKYDFSSQPNNGKNQESFNYVDADSDQDESRPTRDSEYVFQIDDDTEIPCNIGNVLVRMVIDSGSKSNLITDKT